MNTSSIKELLNRMNKTPEDIKDLKIDKFLIDGELNSIDFNDFSYFINMKTLTLSSLNINYEEFKIISELKSIKKLELINCELVELIEDLINEMNIDELVLDNTIIDFNIINHYFNKIVLKNMNYDIKRVNASILDISMSHVKIIQIESIKDLIISYTQYYNNKEFFDNIKEKINVIIKEDNYDFIEAEL